MCSLKPKFFEYEKNLGVIREKLQNSRNPTQILSKIILSQNNFKEELSKIFAKYSVINKPENKFMRIKNLPIRQDVSYFKFQKK